MIATLRSRQHNSSHRSAAALHRPTWWMNREPDRDGRYAAQHVPLKQVRILVRTLVRTATEGEVPMKPHDPTVTHVEGFSLAHTCLKP